MEEYAWFDKNSKEEQYAHNVGSYKPNKWGLYDMHGNVWEYCEDWYGNNHYTSESVKDPMGPSSGRDRVLRGGSWRDRGGDLRSAERDKGGPDIRVNNVGFRLVIFKK